MITITANTTNTDFEKALKPEMESTIEHLQKELVKIRTGRASSSMVEDLKIACYGDSKMSIKEVAAISVPEARMIIIQPWDKGNLGAIEKAVQTSDLGVSPINDGVIVRIQLPQISSSRRDELAKILNKKLEECRVGIRSVRKDFQNSVRAAEKSRILSEDFSKVLLALLQKKTDEYIAQAEQVAQKKEDQIKLG